MTVRVTITMVKDLKESGDAVLLRKNLVKELGARKEWPKEGAGKETESENESKRVETKRGGKGGVRWRKKFVDSSLKEVYIYALVPM